MTDQETPRGLLAGAAALGAGLSGWFTARRRYRGREIERLEAGGAACNFNDERLEQVLERMEENRRQESLELRQILREQNAQFQQLTLAILGRRS